EIHPHFANGLRGTLPNPAGGTDLVHLPTATLNWTAAPYVEVGYRLPAGCGDASLGYRFITSQGTEVPAGDPTLRLHSRLDVNQADLNYTSREIALGEGWGLRWGLGLRLAYVFFDSQADRTLAAAAAGSG